MEAFTSAFRAAILLAPVTGHGLNLVLRRTGGPDKSGNENGKFSRGSKYIFSLKYAEAVKRRQLSRYLHSH